MAAEILYQFRILSGFPSQKQSQHIWGSQSCFENRSKIWSMTAACTHPHGQLRSITLRCNLKHWCCSTRQTPWSPRNCSQITSIPPGLHVGQQGSTRRSADQDPEVKQPNVGRIHPWHAETSEVDKWWIVMQSYSFIEGPQDWMLQYLQCCIGTANFWGLKKALPRDWILLNESAIWKRCSCAMV